jgi:hypothetical protein
MQFQAGRDDFAEWAILYPSKEGLVMYAANLKASIMNVGEYRAVLAALKASQPTKAELAAIVEELTGIKAASSATIRDIYRILDLYGQRERRHAARAKVSRPILPA